MVKDFSLSFREKNVSRVEAVNSESFFVISCIRDLKGKERRDSLAKAVIFHNILKGGKIAGNISVFDVLGIMHRGFEAIFQWKFLDVHRAK